MHHKKYQKRFLAITIFSLSIVFVFSIPGALAAVVVTPATGGGSISADQTGSANWTTLTGPVITETTGRAISTGSGTIILNAPAGFRFNTGATVTAAIVRDAGTGTCFAFSSNNATPAVSTITYTITARDSNAATRCHVTFSNIQTHPTAGAPLASGNITNSGTNAQVPKGAGNNFGTLTEVAGALAKFSFAAVSTQTAGTAFNVAITAQDAFNNTVTGFSGTVNLTTNGGTISPVSSGIFTNGLRTQSVTLTQAGTRTVTATDAGGSGKTGTSNSFTVNNPAPTTSSISPNSATAGDSGFTMTVSGSGFNSSSVVQLNGSSRTTALVNSSTLQAGILTSDLTAAGNFPITVFNPAPGGGTSNSQNFTVGVAPNPAPTVTNISPDTKAANSAAFTMAISGTNFIASSTVQFNGNNRTTTYVNAASLTADILSSDLAAAGSFSVTVANPAPGGGTSNAATFTVTPEITNPVPAISAITPSSKTAGDSNFTMTIDGSNFIANSMAKFDGADRVTSFVNSTQLTAEILSGDLTAAGNFPITVFNPAPGGGTSNSQTFSVTSILLNPTPAISGLNPSSAQAGSSDTSVTIAGSGFIASSTARFNGNDRITSFINSVQIMINILAGDLTAAGNFPITVFNPAPGGGTSNSQTFTVSSPGATSTPPAPTPTAETPATGGSASPREITFSGKAYPGAKLQFVARELRGEIPFSKTLELSGSSDFSITFTEVLAGPQLWGIIAEDKDGRKTRTRYYDMADQYNLQLVQDLFLPPTLGFLRTAVTKGDFITFMGYATPDSRVEIQVDGKSLPGKAQAGSDGLYKIMINTADYEFGNHTAKARQMDSKDTTSDYSPQAFFTVSPLLVPKTDLNGDNKINIQDWSVFLSTWASSNQDEKKKLDFNGDGKVDFQDFSIFLRTIKK